MLKPSIWVLVLTALLVRVPALLSHQSLLPAVAPLGPLPVYLNAWINAQAQGWFTLALLGALADAGSVVLLVYLIERRRLADRLLTPKRDSQAWASPGFWAGLTWAVHPVAGFLAGSAGAWQSLALFALLWAAWNLEFSQHPAAENRAAWSMGVAISTALWPLLLLPLGAAALLSRRARLRFYALALFLPLGLSLPWLLLKDPATVSLAWQGAPSTLGVSGILIALWAAVGAPLEQAQALLQVWQSTALAGIFLYFLMSLWRPVALLPGLALGAWVWILLAPRLQGPLFLAPLGLVLLVPGRLAWRLGASTFTLLVLQQYLPGLKGLQLQQADPYGTWQGTHLIWAAILLTWIFWVMVECVRLDAFARRPQRPGFFE